ncbi:MULTISPECIES: hypothetical protein [unclassified Fibrobacter]|uniref:hypothetical protein n=1 Tax=unclassified Fibrobacter TaxID=2634177 RepID=UPI00091F9209|nr:MULTISPECIES: hypothetical protein [unclassified Fibrobacter]OWV05282.1 hypothetical protein B7993_08385 [Fibrobacter sp. UWH3]SHL30287.1 hypothetical protein SAMN05720765_112119 [Fibrobacter sp. UWH6]
MSKKTTDTTLRDSFLERIKKPGCPSVKTIAEEMNLPKATLYSWIYWSLHDGIAEFMKWYKSDKNPLR